MDTDAVVGTVGGLLALGIVANMAGNMMNGRRPVRRAPRPKPLKVKPHKKVSW